MYLTTAILALAVLRIQSETSLSISSHFNLVKIFAYLAGGNLAVTDANLVLGRLLPQ